MRMHCYIYKGRKKADTYLFVEKQDDFSRVPQPLLALLGRLELIMDIELDASRTLAQADPAQVIGLLREQGYFLQIPPRIETLQ